MLIAMIIWGLALWYLTRLVRSSSAAAAAPRLTFASPLPPLEVGVEDDPGEAREADLVLARLTGQLDVRAYQEAMAALAASTTSRLPGAGRYGR